MRALFGTRCLSFLLDPNDLCLVYAGVQVHQRHYDEDGMLRVLEEECLNETIPIGDLELGALPFHRLYDVPRCRQCEQTGNRAVFLGRLLDDFFLSCCPRHSELPLRLIDKFWLGWFILSIGSFLAMEIYQLIIGHPERTLSAAVWRLERFRTGQPIGEWSAGHLLFFGSFSLIAVWLIFHFGFGLFR